MKNRVRPVDPMATVASSGATPATVPRPAPDWASIKRDFQADALTGPQMALKYGVSRTSVYNKAKRDGWSRTVAAEVKRAVSRQLTTARAEAREDVTLTHAYVTALARSNVDVIRGHRADITALAELSRGQLDELRAVTLKADEILGAIDLLASQGTLEPDDADALVKDLRKTASLSQRIGALTAIGANFDRLQVMERRAFGIAEDAGLPMDGEERERHLIVEFVEAPYRKLE